MTAVAPTGSGVSLRREILTTFLPGFVGTRAPEWLLERLRDGLGGVCIFGPNIESLDQLTELTASLRAANPHAVIAIDEEGGDVTRLFYDAGAPYPGNAVLGRLDEPELTADVARAVGVALTATGCNLTFAPDVDINSNPKNPVIGVRSFGADTELVARHTAAWVEGVQSTGVAASAKHFPGHGDTATDSHLALPVVDLSLDELRRRELAPFRAAIQAGTRTIMTSHILLPQIDADSPATLSSRILHGLLRDELGFEGVIVTDALDMKGASGVHGIPEAAVRALAAGCDLLCFGNANTDEQIETILLAVEVAIDEGRFESAAVTAAAERVRTMFDGLPSAIGSTSEPLSYARVADAFDLGERARAVLAAAHGIGTVVRVDTVANIAVGVAPWGPFAAHEARTAGGLTSWLRDVQIITIAEGEDPVAGELPERIADLSGPVVVIGKDVHRYEFATRAVDALRAERDDVIVVDMGWPSDDRAYADIATFGASRLVGDALLEYLATSSREVGAA